MPTKSLEEFESELFENNPDFKVYLEQYNRLQEIISTMDIPRYRIEDILWLDRNIHFKNSQHEDFEEAWKLIKAIIKFRRNECE